MLSQPKDRLPDKLSEHHLNLTLVSSVEVYYLSDKGRQEDLSDHVSFGCSFHWHRVILI